MKGEPNELTVIRKAHTEDREALIYQQCNSSLLINA